MGDALLGFALAAEADEGCGLHIEDPLPGQANGEIPRPPEDGGLRMTSVRPPLRGPGHASYHNIASAVARSAHILRLEKREDSTRLLRKKERRLACAEKLRGHQTGKLLIVEEKGVSS